MSLDLLIQPKKFPISVDRFYDSLAAINKAYPSVGFTEFSKGQMWGEIDKIRKCDIAYNAEKGEIQISVTSSFAKYLDFFAAAFAEKLEAKIFDPQLMKEVEIEPKSINIASLKHTPEELVRASKEEKRRQIFAAMMIIAKIPIGLFDFEQGISILSYLENNAFGPIYLPSEVRNYERKHKFETIRKEFLDKCQITITDKDYVVVHLPETKGKVIPYVAFKKES